MNTYKLYYPFDSHTGLLSTLCARGPLSSVIYMAFLPVQLQAWVILDCGDEMLRAAVPSADEGSGEEYWKLLEADGSAQIHNLAA